MSDRELLELAARAAGYTLEIESDGSNPVVPYAADHPRKQAGFHGFCWNPLEDDGDALRLAVKLRMELSVISDRVSAQASSPRGSLWTAENVDADPYTAARRAIVRAAAEVGKAKP